MRIERNPFRVGDIVKGTNNIYNTTNYEMLEGKVIRVDIWNGTMDIKVLKHVHEYVLGYIHTVKNSSELFELVPKLELEEKPKKIDKEKIEKHFREILIALGEDPDREGLKETPKRVAKSYGEIFEGLQYTNSEIAEMYDKGFTDEDMSSSVDGFGEFVMVKNIKAYSCCEHHVLPEILDVHVAYIPSKKVVGLSKIPRIVKMVCKRLQLQERIAKDIYEVMNMITGTEDIAIIISGEHLCMSMRGVEDVNSRTDSALFMGKFKENYQLRQELLNCIGRDK